MTSVEQNVILHFDKDATKWWDENGPFSPLHRLNPLRLDFIVSHLELSSQSISRCTLLDVGCGGGLMCEPFARLGATVSGIDASAIAIAAAKHHAKEQELDIEYLCTTPEEIEKNHRTYDIVLCLEVLEHVNHPKAFIQSCFRMLRPGGTLFVSTLNKTRKSYLLGIFAAEYILRWIPRGTHQWGKFLKPSQIMDMLRDVGGTLVDIKGMTFSPLSQSWFLTHDYDVNYVMVFKKT